MKMLDASVNRRDAKHQHFRQQHTTQEIEAEQLVLVGGGLSALR